MNSNQQPMRYRPRLEPLEGRELPSAGALDPTFNGSGKATVSFNTGDFGGGTDVVIDAAGRIILSGTTGSPTHAPGDSDFALARLNANGSLDGGFGGTGRVFVPFNIGAENRDSASGLALDRVGRIVVSGTAADGVGRSTGAVARLNADGSLDASFDGDGRVLLSFGAGQVLDEIRAVATDAAGRIVAAGRAQRAGTLDFDWAVARLNGDGSLDAGFNGTGRQLVAFGPGFNSAQAVAVDAAGRIVVAGYAARAGGTDLAVIRLNADGSFDTGFGTGGRVLSSFNPGGGASDSASAVALDAAGRIVVAGFGATSPGAGIAAVARLNPDGSFDAGFGANGRVVLPFDAPGGAMFGRTASVAIDAENRVVVAGSVIGGGLYSDFAVVRLRADGSLDPDFGSNGRTVIPFDLDRFNGDSASAVTIDAGGAVVVAGSAGVGLGAEFAVARLQGDHSAFPLPANARLFVTGADAGGGPDVKIFDAATGRPIHSFFAYDPGFTGGVRVAVGDVNADGVPDLITAAGPGGGPNVIVRSGKDLSSLFNFFAFDTHFTGGCYVAAGDVNGDGFADIIVGADAGGGPNVTVFDGRTGTPFGSFFAYDRRFTGGVRVAAGDVNGDTFADVICGAGPGGGPNVLVVSGRDGVPLASFFTYDRGFSSGVFVAAGRVTGTGPAEVIAGAAAGGGPNVAVFQIGNGANVLQSYFPYDMRFTGGVRVAAADRNADGRADVLSVPGPGGGPDVCTADGLTGKHVDDFFAYDIRFTGGLFVAANG